jgi:dynein heavy chain
MKKEKWVKDHPGQTMITAGQILWTAECEKALSDADGAKKALKLLKKKWISYLTKLTAVTCSKLDPINRNKVSARAVQPVTSGSSTGSCWAVHRSCGWLVVFALSAPTLRDPSAAGANVCGCWCLGLQVVALITIEVHARDVIDKLCKANCSSINDFEWVSQLRFYWDTSRTSAHGGPASDPPGNCVVKQVLSVFDYGYEYQGNNGRLVITPLTDR